ncbi:heavy metal translocating P-type ATPase [Amycolatopsis lexingtonensis]|uniref:Heavy metal translocating P-type ATPase n=1 Tax=Amycolatopsis lexingtonensis TaxID=218822 RepID=A0ABR9HSL3_9PSEU|nr:heavy metal translocating P-type ATPase [Amycolatopsis lexingtonensis]MBE1493914.1 heavy metal translocating P-type ATPase [Amycolatopsis lexingtonensis]
MRAEARREVLLLGAVLLLVAGGGLAWWADAPAAARLVWAAADVVTLVPAVVWVAADLRARRWGADLLAVLALVSTLAVGEFLAGAIVAAMVATGRVLEAGAQRRASRNLTALLDRAPRVAHLRTATGHETVPVDAVRPGQLIVVLPGEVVPVDGVLPGGGTFDESALTGEPLPVSRPADDTVHSGVVNAGAAVDVRASAAAADSAYAGVVRLAEEAAARTAGVARIADRVAVWFLPASLLIAALAWLLTGEAERAVAVLVTATPCPLLLAVPIAVTGGMSRASKAGVVVKDGAALEALGRASVLLMDKTGTVTRGRPEITDIVCAPGHDVAEVLAHAAGVEQYSPHVLAAAVVRAAASAGVAPAPAGDITEEVGSGVRGRVGARRVRVGRSRRTDLPSWARGAARRGRLDLASVLWVEFDGEPVAALLAKDPIRPDAARTMRRLRAAGIGEVRLLTGDRVDNAREVAAMLGLDDVHAEVTPAEKVAEVDAARARGVTVMTGDGVNDAPALAAADVGVALGSRGATAAAQAADAVILDDRLDRLADAAEIARRSHRLAVQSAVAGTLLSLVAMLAAAGGFLVPIAGALVQEAIDVVVILNALRALGDRKTHGPAPAAMVRRFESEHERLLPARAAVRQAADALAEGATPTADTAVRTACSLLIEQLLPHEEAEETELYPALAAALGGPEGTVTMSREHAEIGRLARRLQRHLAEAPDGIQPDQVDDLRATLYGLDAVLTLHFAQEEEAYFTLPST